MRDNYYENSKDYINRWVVSYADLVTMLLALFLVMYAVNVTKYQAMAQEVQQNLKVEVIESVDEKLEKINNQTLIINGKLDKDTPVYMAKRLKKGIKNSQLMVFEGAGHFCFIDKPAKFNLLTREFLTT